MASGQASLLGYSYKNHLYWFPILQMSSETLEKILKGVLIFSFPKCLNIFLAQSYQHTLQIQNLSFLMVKILLLFDISKFSLATQTFLPFYYYLIRFYRFLSYLFPLYFYLFSYLSLYLYLGFQYYFLYQPLYLYLGFSYYFRYYLGPLRSYFSFLSPFFYRSYLGLPLKNIWKQNLYRFAIFSYINLVKSSVLQNSKMNMPSIGPSLILLRFKFFKISICSQLKHLTTLIT